MPAPRPGWRPRAPGRLARRFGPQFVLPTLADMEQVGQPGYDGQPEARDTALPAERALARAPAAAIADGAGRLEGAALAQIEGRHRASSGNALRAAVLGANDGLVSNLSLVMGVAGAALGETHDPDHRPGRPARRGRLDGLGEWISVQSSRELYERQIAIEARRAGELPRRSRRSWR